MKKIYGMVVLLLGAISSGVFVYTILKKAGLDNIFNFDLYEDIDREDF